MENNERKEEKNTLRYNFIVVCVCIVLFCIFVGFAIFQNFRPKPIYVDPPVDEGVEVAEINNWNYSNPIYKGEPIEYSDLVYRGEPIEYTYLK